MIVYKYSTQFLILLLSFQQEIKDRDNLLAEHELASNELQKIQQQEKAAMATPATANTNFAAKIAVAQQKLEAKKTAFDAIDQRVEKEMQSILQNRGAHFDAHVQKVPFFIFIIVSLSFLSFGMCGTSVNDILACGGTKKSFY